jgi:16S rRNA (uracil1498-N3)-methyltransferase
MKAAKLKDVLVTAQNLKKWLMTGPEAVCEPEEAAFAIENGMRSVSIGPRILRCETAPSPPHRRHVPPGNM